MKLTTIMYVLESVNRKALRARNSVFWLNFQEFLDYIKNCPICHALTGIVSLRKFLFKLGHIWGVLHEKLPRIGSKWLLLLSSKDLSGLCNFMRSFICQKTWGANQRVSKDVT